jgi:5'-nucleotidase
VAVVRLAHFSDYHAHALPRPASGDGTEGGLARALAFLAPLAKEGTIVLSGGDMLSRGSPSWSDRYGCADWPWLDGVVHAMAFGNHDADYGPDAFARCRASVRFPILSANLVDADGKPFLAPYAVFERSGVKVGVFAVAGPDFGELLGESTLPFRGARFADRVVAAREVVRKLREEERAAAVVLVGHEHRPDDADLVARVPGIDLVFGTHSHHVAPLERIPGTDAWTISAGAYLANVGLVELAFRGGRLESVRGRLVPLTRLPEDSVVAERIARMQAELEADPAWRHLFLPVATLAEPLTTEGGLSGDSPLGRFVTGVMRKATGARVAFANASSLREPLPRGTILEEQLRAALPYPNGLLVYRLSGEQLLDLLAGSVSLAGSDLTAVGSGLHYRVEGGRPVDVTLVGDEDPPGSAGTALDPSASYDVALTDFMARRVEPYRSLLRDVVPRETGLEVRELVRGALAAGSPR